MNDAADHLTQRLLARQAFVVIVAFGAIALLAPGLLLLEWDVTAGVLWALARASVLALLVTAGLALVRIRAHRYVLRALALGSHAIEPEDLSSLSKLPAALALRFFTATSLLSIGLLVPGLGATKIDAGRSASLVVLCITILGASTIPHYVLTRAATIRLFELGPLDAVTTMLEAEELQHLPARRVVSKLLLAVVAPVALVGAGAVLVVHAHLRALDEETHKQTAVLLARSALEPAPGALSEAGRADAIAAAAEVGFLAHLERGEQGATSYSREADGQLVAKTALDDGTAVVRFSTQLDFARTSSGAAVAILAVLVAALVGTVLGQILSGDLVLATRKVRLLGTESVLRGGTEIAQPARFRLVGDLGRAIEVLAERFRVFAAAQERALEAREAAQRMRGLLFASVSHDLKSPLNAILGFTELVSREELTTAQRESLALIETRGRELLALIETILDAARVEAGQLTLAPRRVDVGALVAEACDKARELVPGAPAPLVVDLPPDLPPVWVDAGHAIRALAVVIAHALRTTTDPILVQGAVTEDATGGEHVVVDVVHPPHAVSPRELDALFARQVTSRGRGLTLGLSLARSVLELHGGGIEVPGATPAAAVSSDANGATARCWLPLRPTQRKRLSSYPALG